MTIQEEFGAKPYTRPLAKGKRIRSGLRMCFDLDDDTFKQLRAEAVRRKLSMAGTMRLMIEWGLETAEEERKSR